jgi:hypothetical protein
MNLDPIYIKRAVKIGIGKNPTNICSQQKIPKQRKKNDAYGIFLRGIRKTMSFNTKMVYCNVDNLEVPTFI